MATSILRSFTFRAEKANPALFRALGETTDASKSGRILRFSVVHQAAKRLLRLKSARSFQHEEHLRAIRLYSIGVYYSLDVVLLLATGILPEKEPVHFHFMHNVKAAEPESIRQPAQRRRKKRQRPDFDAPVFRLSALARVIRTQAAKKKGRKIDVDPAFPPEIRGASDADLASTSAESPPARKPCVHQFKKVG